MPDEELFLHIAHLIDEFIERKEAPPGTPLEVRVSPGAHKALTDDSPMPDKHRFTINGVPVHMDASMPSDKVLVRPREEGG